MITRQISDSETSRCDDCERIEIAPGELEACPRCGGRLCAECLFDHCLDCDEPFDALFSVTNLSH
jgi:hypothetical protein